MSSPRSLLLLLCLVPFLMAPDYNVPFRPRTAAGGGLTQRWYSAVSDGMPVTDATTVYFGLMGAESVGFATGAVTQVDGVFAAPATVGPLRCDLTGDVGGASDSFTITVMLSATAGATPTDSTIACTITGSGTDTSCTDSETLEVAAGDRGGYKGLTAETTGLNSGLELQCNLGIQTETANYSIYMGHATANNTATRYYAPAGVVAPNGTDGPQRMMNATPGTLRDLYVYLGTAPDNGGGTQTRTYAVMLNGSAFGSTIDCPISEAGTTCSELVTTGAIIGGDELTIQDVTTGTPLSGETGYGFVIDSDNAGEFNVPVTTAGLNTTTTQYFYTDGGTAALFSGETNAQGISTDAHTVKRAYVELSADPGGTADRVFTLREDADGLGGGATADTSITMTVESGTTTESDTSGDEAIAGGALLGWRSVPNTTPTSATARIGMAVTIP